MKFILTLNRESPFNLRRTSYNPDLLRTMTEDAAIALTIVRNKEVGVIPCESKEEREACVALHTTKHPTLPPIDLPPIGVHHIVDEVDLPGGSVSDDNDYFFDAWEWAIDHADVNMPKARDVHMGHIRVSRDIELQRQDTLLIVATETGNATEETRIKALKQTLRDISSSFDLSVFVTPESLKQAWPVELPDRI